MQPPLPAQSHVPAQAQQPASAPDAPMPQPSASTINLRQIAPLASQEKSPVGSAAQIQQAESSTQHPWKESPSAVTASPFRLIAPYRASRVPDLPNGTSIRLSGLIHEAKLYLSLRDAIALAIENNLDVEVGRYSISLADTDLLRAEGGGNLRGLDYTVQGTAPGTGSATSPLLVTTTNGGNTSPTNAQVTDLSQVSQTGSTQQQSLSQNSTNTYAPGPPIPLYDPNVTAELGFLHRENQASLIETTGGTSANSGPLDFVNTSVDYQQGFSFGAQLEAFVSNAPQVLYANGSQYDPFHAPSTSVTFTQPLLRGRGRSVNLRFLHIARLNQQVSRLLFEQQLLETVYGISRLYYDLVSLGENVGVREEALAAAQKLYDDDRSQVAEGTLAPIELTRAQALLSSSRLDLIQARGEYRQQEVILRQQLLRNLSDPATQFTSIVPTDRIEVPSAPPELNVPALTADALANRPDLAQAALQIQANAISAKATANGVRPALNFYANAQTRGSALVPYQSVGSTGTGTITTPAALTQGGLRLSTIYQGGIQLNLPLRNRIAQADAARDAIQLRQSEGRTLKLENQIRQQVENSTIALETAHQAYGAAVESRNYQQQLLQSELEKFAVGASTNFQIVQDEAYLAQARATEVAARSDYMKAQMSLDRSLGNLLGKNGIVLDEAMDGTLNSAPVPLNSVPVP